VSVKLCLEESFGEDLEKGLAGGQADVELSLRAIEAETAALTTGENDDADLAIANQGLADGLESRFLQSRHGGLISDVLRVD